MTEVVTQVTSTLFGTGGAIPTVFSWITSSAVLPYFAIGIACSLGLFAIRGIRSVVWGA